MTTPDLSTIPGRLAWARAQTRLTPNRLSVLAGLDRSHVRLIEDGGRRTAAETVGKLAAFLGVTTDWMISGVGPQPDAEALRELGRQHGAGTEDTESEGDGPSDTRAA